MYWHVLNLFLYRKKKIIEIEILHLTEYLLLKPIKTVIIITDCIIIVFNIIKWIKYKFLLRFGQLISNEKSIIKTIHKLLIYNFQ